jgi:hypothetical protein
VASGTKAPDAQAGCTSTQSYMIHGRKVGDFSCDGRQTSKYGGHGKKLPECQECQDFRLGISSLLPSYLKWVLFRNNCH